MTTTFDGPALVLDSVVKTFGDKRAVDDLTMSVPAGTVLAFLGPNGAGKTTTIEMCEGFITPTSGSIRVLGLDPATQPEQVRERIGIMLQGGGSYNGATVEEMLQLSASYNADPLDPEWLLDILGLSEARKTTYRRLSGGQKQRLSLAQALISRPELVFLDEPTAGMDTQARMLVWEIIEALRRDGVTVVLTTHMMDEAEALADDIVIIDQGRTVAQGTPSELTSTGDSGIESISVETDRDLGLANLPPEMSAVSPLQYRVELPATPELVALITSEAARQNVLIRSLTVTHRNLEDVFLDITGRELRR